MPHLVQLAVDVSGFATVTTLGLDEPMWHHTPDHARAEGPTKLTGLAVLTRDLDGPTRVLPLNLVPGGPGSVRHSAARIGD